MIDPAAVFGEAFAGLFIAHQQASLIENFERSLVYLFDFGVAEVAEEFHDDVASWQSFRQ